MRPSFKQLIGKSDLVIAEIGVDCGNNAYENLTNLDISTYYLIDPYSLYMIGQGCNMTEEQCVECEAVAQEKLKGFEDKIVWIKEKSEDAVYRFADNSIDLVYIDGNHRVEFVLKDLWFYYLKVKHGGILAGHDSNYVAVYNAVAYFGACFPDNFITFEKCEDRVGATDYWVYKP